MRLCPWPVALCVRTIGGHFRILWLASVGRIVERTGWRPPVRTGVDLRNGRQERPPPMIFKPRTSALQRDWRTEIDTSLEAGQTPLLDLGSSQQMLRGLPILMALRTFAARRVDVAAPNLLIGGNPVMWLVCLMQ